MSASFDFTSASAAEKIAHLEARLNAALTPQSVHIDDDSAAHAGHAGAASGSHYTVTIVADCFAGRARVARHRLVYDALAEELRRGVHALAIRAYTPQEFAEQFE
ncbi:MULTISPECIES: BolA family protein [Caballeronia]|uniref:BolA family protein n=1 Tax=Caballeronia TaxID=1827195 RepID=UPI00045EE02D|nr:MULTISPECIES: BolA family protein [unclassified Caballeronia]MCE4541891.1 BolA family transcriptional regulator [Caballeronia sp. PC1]MCE4569064.1 BolA family transcriptional regulator [Caballeronia sp. CLC5]BAO86325.1 BolA-like protein [Burkholderia sp. RPE67]BBP96216.1 BolA family transcriptional regulator [Burkholderia sp. SFA1]